jgi:Flp pilus assembly protein TadG
MTTSRPNRSHLIADETGSEIVEFALCAVVILMSIFGILDCSRALYTDHYVANAARDGARYAMVRGSTWTPACATTASYNCAATSTNVSNYVKTVTPLGLNSTSLTITSTWPGTTASGVACMAVSGNNSPGCVVRVKVAYNFNFMLPFLPLTTMAIVSTSAVGISQ